MLGGERGVGTFGGSEDHTAILCARSNALARYSFCPVRRERIVDLPVGHVFVVATSGVVAEKSGAALASYNRLAVLAREAAARWREKSGRDDATLGDALRATSGDVAPIVAALGRAGRDGSETTALEERVRQFAMETGEIIPAATDALFPESFPSSEYWSTARCGTRRRCCTTRFRRRFSSREPRARWARLPPRLLAPGLEGACGHWSVAPRRATSRPAWVRSIARRFPTASPPRCLSPERGRPRERFRSDAALSESLHSVFRGIDDGACGGERRAPTGFVRDRHGLRIAHVDGVRFEQFALRREIRKVIAKPV